MKLRRAFCWALIALAAILVVGWQFVYGPGCYYEVVLSALTNFDLNQTNGTDSDIPSNLRALNGRDIVIDGEVAPRGIGNPGQSFILIGTVRDGHQLKVQHFILVDLPAHSQFDSYDSVRVWGTLHVGIERSNGQITSVFRMQADRVEAVNSSGPIRVPGGGFAGSDGIILALAAAGAIRAIVAYRRTVRTKRLIRRGRCPICGYDLRATPVRCPECGNLVQHN